MKKILLSCLLVLFFLCEISIYTMYSGDLSVEKFESIYDMGTAYTYADSVGNEYELWITDDGTLTLTCAKNKGSVIKEIVIPDTVNRIINEGINFISVEKVYIPSTVSEICVSSLEWNYAKEFIVDSKNPDFCSVDGVVYTKDMTKMLGYPNGKNEKVLKIPDTVEEIRHAWELVKPETMEYVIFSATLKELPSIPVINIKAFYITSIEEFQYDSLVSYAIEFYHTEMKYGAVVEPKIVYLTEGSPYIEQFSKDSAWLPIVEDNYSLKHASMALKMGLGIYETQIDLREYYKTEEEKLLFDEDNNDKVDLEDVQIVLEKALGIK